MSLVVVVAALFSASALACWATFAWASLPSGSDVSYRSSWVWTLAWYRMEDPSGAIVARSVRLIPLVPDPDASTARANAAGAREVSAVGNEHGWRVGRIVDPFGHQRVIARPLS
jgi:hypothetical protein